MKLYKDFRNFVDEWVEFCVSLENEGLTKQARGKLKGKRFEEIFLELLRKKIKKEYKILPQATVKGLGYIFDFVIVTKKVKIVNINPKDIIAVIEVKSHGIYGYENINNLKDEILALQNLNPKIRYFYITYRETDTYDNQVRLRLGSLVNCYYRLTDSGDGVQLEPKRIFPEAWDRLLSDLKKL